MRNHQRYHLQTLFELREKDKKSAEEAFVVAQSAAKREKNKLDSLIVEHEKMLSFRNERILEYSNKAVSGILTAQNMNAQKQHIESLKLKERKKREAIVHQEDSLRQAEIFSTIKFKDMLRASQEFKALEKLKHKWTAQITHKLLRREEEFSDEISQAQYSKK